MAVGTQHHSQDQLHGRILLAEDCPDSQVLLAHVLESAGAKVTVANNGAECEELALCALLDREPFDMILVDIQMPKVDGYTAARSLRNKGYQLPIVSMTARTRPEEAEESAKAGCNAHISKLEGKNALLAALVKQLTPVAPQVEEKKIELPLLAIMPEGIHENRSEIPAVLNFIERLPEILTALDRAGNAGNWEELSQGIVRLGMAPLLGYTIFSGYMQRFQEAATRKDSSLFGQIMREFTAIARRVQAGRARLEQMQLP